jgi:hypothetical protein
MSDPSPEMKGSSGKTQLDFALKPLDMSSNTMITECSAMVQLEPLRNKSRRRREEFGPACSDVW